MSNLYRRDFAEFPSSFNDPYLYSLTCRQLTKLLLWELTDWEEFPSSSSISVQKNILTLYRSTYLWMEEWSVNLTQCKDYDIVNTFFDCKSRDQVKSLISGDFSSGCPFDPGLLLDPNYCLEPSVWVYELELIEFLK